MDIAEIRKKARVGKNSVNVPPVPQPVSVQPVVEQLESVSAVAVVAATPEAAVSPAPLVAVSDASGIERLFSWRPEADSNETLGFDSKFNALQEHSESISRRWLAFVLGEEEYALDITNIREIIKPREITDIPRVPPFLLGIISLRGNIIPILDMKKRLRLGETELTADSRIIVCQYGERFAGLLVDRISQVVSMPESNIEPPPAVLSGIDRDLVAGVGRLHGKMMILPHLSSVLNVELAW